MKISLFSAINFSYFLVQVIFTVLEVSFWALTTVFKLLWKFSNVNYMKNQQSARKAGSVQPKIQT